MSRNSASISRTRCASSIGAARARDRDVDVAELRLEPFRPGVALGRRAARCGSPPAALQRSRASSPSACAAAPVDRHRRVVPGAVAPAGGRPPAALRPCRDARACPSATAVMSMPPQKASASSIDDDLVVVAGAERVGAVELEVDLLAPRPAGQAEDRGAAAEQLDRADVPFQDVDRRGPAGSSRARRGTARAARARRRRRRRSSRMRVSKSQPISRICERAFSIACAGVLEIVGGVDDQRGPVRARDPPAIAPRLRQRTGAGPRSVSISMAAQRRSGDEFRLRNDCFGTGALEVAFVACHAPDPISPRQRSRGAARLARSPAHRQRRDRGAARAGGDRAARTGGSLLLWLLAALAIDGVDGSWRGWRGSSSASAADRRRRRSIWWSIISITCSCRRCSSGGPGWCRAPLAPRALRRRSCSPRSTSSRAPT